MSVARKNAETPDGQSQSPLKIQSGQCYVLFAYDVGISVDLDLSERLTRQTTQRETIKHKRRAPKYFEYRPLPLRITHPIEPFELAGYQSEPLVDLVVYDFGAVSVIYTLPLAGAFQGIRDLSDRLYDNTQLLADSRQRVEELLDTIRPAVTKPEISDFVEDYFIFEIAQFDAECSPGQLFSRYREFLAQILRSERQTLSEQEVFDAVGCRISFGSHDITIIDWNAALLYDRDAEDVRTVLEFANVELLEMRYVDQKLDDALDKAYRFLSTRSGSKWHLLFGAGADLEDIAQLQVDNAILFEGVNNALKLLGDQYLARVYQQASQRLHLADWDGSILRKLETLESIYTKLSNRATSFRMELLEWIIIVLIAISIVIAFIPGLSRH